MSAKQPNIVFFGARFRGLKLLNFNVEAQAAGRSRVLIASGGGPAAKSLKEV